ncbi:MAG: DUF2341 domain-containing protein, partial [Candidatus Hodarchaeales archaeon]
MRFGSLYSKKLLINGLFLSIFFVNIIVLGTQIQPNEEFLESNPFLAEILRGLGVLNNNNDTYHAVSILSGTAVTNSHSDESQTNLIRSSYQSQYSVPGWVDTRWQFRQNITIQASQIPSDLTDYPFLLDKVFTELCNNVQVDGGDIFFTNSTGDKLDHEIEKLDWHYSSTQVHLVTWVRIPFLSSTVDTKISMYYGNPTSPNQENPEGVWDSGYAGVWHMKEDPSGSAPQIKDSTQNGIDGTSMGSMTSSDLIEGKTGGSLDFDGSDDYISLGNQSSLKLTSAFTVEVLYNGFSIPDRATLYSTGFKYQENIGLRVSGYHSSGNPTPVVFFGNGTIIYWTYADNTLSENIWVHLVVTYEGSTLKMYINGQKQLDEDVGPIDYNAGGSAIGGSMTVSNERFNGSIDEVRVSSLARPENLTKTNYANLFNPGSFYSISPKETSPVRIDWAQPLFRYRKNVTIDATQVSGSGSLTNFPLLLNLSDTNLADTDKVQSDGDDIIFTDSSGTKLDHEIELFDQTGNGTHANLVAWIRVPSLSGTVDTNITMYYGNNAVGSQENPEGVWDNNYVGVWHLSEDPSGAYPQMKDSTASSHDGTSSGSMVSNDLVEGKIEKAIDFEASKSQSIEIPDSNDFDLTETVIVSAWINVPASILATGEYHIIAHNNWFGRVGYVIMFRGGDLEFRFHDGIAVRSLQTSLHGITADTWHHVIGYFDRPVMRLYVDGAQVADTTLNYAINHNISMAVRIGSTAGGSGFYIDGSIDEVRIRSVSPSANWISTEYNNQNDTNSFYSVSDEEEYSRWWADASFTKRKDIVIDKDKVGVFNYQKTMIIDSAKVSGSGSLTNFPVLINLFDTNLHNTSKVQADGDDIIFTDLSGTKLDHELELFDQNYNSTHAQLVTWVRIPSLSAISDTEILMRYGNDNIGNQENPEGIWDSNYAGVWHLSETSGGSLAIKDSTTNANHGTNYGTVELGGSGQISGGIGIDEYADYISIADSNSLDITTDLTLSVWTKAENFEYQLCVIAKDEDPSSPYAIWYQNSTNDIRFNLEGVETTGASGVTVNRDAWMYVVMTYDGASISIYKDGNVGYSVGDSGTITSNNQPLQFGREEMYGDYFLGYMDEVRISNTSRSAEWILTEYNNQYDPSSFISVGSEEDPSYIATDFPVLIDITISELRTGFFQPDADDLIFTTANGSKLDHEIDYFNQQSANGHLVAWVRVPTLSAAEDTVLSMYYGRDDLSSQENPEKVWDSNYVAVWHLSEDPTTTVYDSTANSNDGNDNNSMASNDLISSKIGLGLDFDHVDDHLIVPYSDNLGIVGNTLSLEAWVYLPTVPLTDDAAVIELANATNKERYMLGVDSGSDPALLNSRVTTSDGHFRYDNGSINQGSWTYISVVYDGSLGTTPRLFSYIDGLLIASNDASGNIDPITSNYNLSIGKRFNGRLYEGRMDELRISNSARSSDYISTSHNNQKNPSSFYSLGTEVEFDADPPVIEDFGIDDLGTGIGKFWAKITDESTNVASAKVTINNTEYSMESNSSHWIYILPVAYQVYYEYQITNTTDTFGNFLITPSSNKNYTFTYDALAPDVLEWKYKTSTNTFRANVSDSWGELDTVIVNITSHSTALPDPATQIMSFYQDFGVDGLGYINDTMAMSNGDIEFKIFVNDTSGNSFISTTHPGVVFINHAPIAGNITLTPDPLFSNSTLTMDYDYYDEDGHQEVGTEILWYNNSELQVNRNGSLQISSTYLEIGDEWYVTIRPKDNDGLFGDLVNSSDDPGMITVVNTPPQVTAVEITSSNPVTTTTLTINYQYSDYDGHGENTGLREIFWYINGTYDNTYDNQASIASTETTKGESWYYRIRVSDGTNYSNVITSNTVIIGNSLPAAENLTITTNPTTLEDLVIGWNYSDADSDPEIKAVALIEWFKNGLPMSEFDNDTTIPFSRTNKTQTWYYRLKVFDGLNYSDWIELPQGDRPTILNSQPEVLSPTYDDLTTTSSENLDAIWDYSDADEDTQIPGLANITWYLGGIHQSDYNNLTFVLAADISKGDQWNYIIMVYDGTDYSNPLNSSIITIVNTPPTVSSASFVDLTTTSNETLVASWGYSDYDGDSQNIGLVNITWYKGGVYQPAYDNTTSIVATNLAKNDDWNYIIQVFDSTDYSASVNSSVITIQNSLPIVTGLSFINTTPTTLVDLEADWNYTDADNDLEIEAEAKIDWYRNGAPQSSYDNDTIIPWAETTKNQLWYYKLWVYDGEDWSDVYTSESIQILNSKPQAVSPTFQDLSVTSSEDLVADWGYTDADIDPQIVESAVITWFKFGVHQPNYDNEETILASALTKNDVWNYTISVYDGQEYSNNASSGLITILNTLPVVPSTPIFTIGFPTSSDDLDASWSYSDYDGDFQSVGLANITWYRGGAYQPAYDNNTNIAAANLAKNDEWNYIIQVYDGEEYSIYYNSTSVTISNSLPTVTNPAFNDSSIDATEDFNITYSYQDVDSDTEDQLKRVVYWYIDGSYNSAYDNKTVIYAVDNTTEGDYWTYILRVYDGEDWSINYT